MANFTWMSMFAGDDILEWSKHHSLAIWNFDWMIKCVTGNNGMYYIKGYGCCCNEQLMCDGIPVDDIDRS